MDKKKSRREFIELGLKTSFALPLLTASLSSCGSKVQEDAKGSAPTSKKLKILILGGTSFLGPHQIAYAINRGHSISTFTRGKTKPSVHKDIFEKVEQLVGDRENDLSALKDRKWDVVIDNSGRKVEWTKSTAELLKDNCDLYVYTSSTGVFYPYINSEFKEDSEVLHALPEEYDEEFKFVYDYGIMKANSEQAAIKAFGKERTIVIRPTYMIGPADKTNRFIHWPIRLSQGGEIMIPGKENDSVQYVDVRDVAEWMIRLAEERKAGTYNAVGPKEAQNMYSFIEEASKAFEVESSFVKIDDYDFLEENNIQYIVPWIIPLGSQVGSAKINNQKAKANGLEFRPLVDTVKETFAWWNSAAVSQELRDKVEKDPNSILAREASIIKKWKEQKKTE